MEKLQNKLKQNKINKKQRERRKKNGNLATHKYEKTINGFLMRIYRNMKSRINGIQKIKYHLYAGKDLLDKKLFYKWAKDSKDFHILYKYWVLNNYNQKLTPSVDRINSSEGYHISNMEWVTNSENSRRGSLSLKRKK